MRTNFASALAMLAGLGLGAAAVEGLNAQAKPPVYWIAENELTTMRLTGRNICRSLKRS